MAGEIGIGDWVKWGINGRIHVRKVKDIGERRKYDEGCSHIFESVIFTDDAYCDWESASRFTKITELEAAILLAKYGDSREVSTDPIVTLI